MNNNNSFNNMITNYTNKVTSTVAVSKLGFVDKVDVFCETFMSYMFIHFRNIYENSYVSEEVKENINQLYNYITN